MQSLLASLPSTGVSVQPGLQPVLDCCAAFEDYKVPEGDDPVSVVVALMDLSTLIARKSGSVPATPEGQEPVSAWEAPATAFSKWAEVSKLRCCGKSLQMIINAPSPETPWNYKKMLAPEYHSFALALQKAASLKDDAEALGRDVPEFEDVTKRLTLFEAVTSALDADWMKGPAIDPLFSELKTQYESFLRLFQSTSNSLLKDFEDTHFPVLQAFIDSYSPVAVAAEKWQMNGVSAVFTDKKDETRESLEQLIAAKGNVGVVMGFLESFCSHVSSSAALNEIIGKAKALYKTGSSLIKEADRIGGILLVGAVLWNTDSKPEDAKATLDMAKSSFDTVKEKLPAKMQKLLGELLKLSGEEAAAGNDAKEKPEKKAEKTPGRKRRAAVNLVDEDEAEKPKESKRSKDGKDGKDRKKEKLDKSDKSEKLDKEKPEKPQKRKKRAVEVLSDGDASWSPQIFWGPAQGFARALLLWSDAVPLWSTVVPISFLHMDGAADRRECQVQVKVCNCSAATFPSPTAGFIFEIAVLIQTLDFRLFNFHIQNLARNTTPGHLNSCSLVWCICVVRFQGSTTLGCGAKKCLVLVKTVFKSAAWQLYWQLELKFNLNAQFP